MNLKITTGTSTATDTMNTRKPKRKGKYNAYYQNTYTQ